MGSAMELGIGVLMTENELHTWRLIHGVPSDWSERSKWREANPDAPKEGGWGYENGESWGAGQEAPFQKFWKDRPECGDCGEDMTECWCDGEPAQEKSVWLGYGLAGTWNGVIVWNETLLREANRLKKKCAEWGLKGADFVIVGPQT